MAGEEEKAPILRSKASIRDSKDDGFEGGDDEKIKVYWWRWVVLLVFVANLGINNGIWLTFGPIADVVKCYYNVSDFLVNSLSMVYMATYISLIVPSVWMMEKLGLRAMSVIAACLNAIGACLRVAGVAPENFWLLLIGQAVASLSTVLLWGGPSYLAGIWFPSSQRGIAAAAGGALAPQIGVLTGFVFSPLLVHSKHTNAVCSGDISADLHYTWTETIYHQLLYYLSGQAGVSLLLIFVTLVAFPSAPPTPPSRSQLLVSSTGFGHLHGFGKVLRSIFTNGYFLLLLLTASINIGAAGAIVSLLNELIHPYFEDRDGDLVYIGLTAQLSAILAVFITGTILGATKAFYAMNLIIYTVTALAIGGFLAALEFQRNFYVLYPLAGLIGASVTAFQAIVYEYAAEMTYPLPEGTSGGLVNWVSQPMGILMIVVGPKFFSVNGHKVPAAWTIAALTLAGAIVTIFIRPELRKTNIDSQKPVVQSSLTSSVSQSNHS